MAAGSNAGSLHRSRLVQRQKDRAEESVREAAAGLDLTYRARLLLRRELWGMFPVKMRPFWIAQRGRCSICGGRMALERDVQHLATWDHVIPRARGGGGHEARNKVIAHRPCNQHKGDRAPTACELLFCIVTNEIVFSINRVNL